MPFVSDGGLIRDIQRGDEMDTAEMVRLCKAHTMYSWSAGDAVDPLPITGAEGIYFWGPDGRKLLDFNSHVMSVNVGHGHPHVLGAMRETHSVRPSGNRSSSVSAMERRPPAVAGGSR